MFPKVKDAVKEAFKKVRPPKSYDAEVLQYEKLKPSDFPQLVEKHGIDVVEQYIKDMESRRSKYDTNTKSTPPT